ncbi:MAG: hypothetical protein NZ480_00425 [Bdellovibrionaceae bacterium]|nr:hypothetical protein [Pseudobdellovibrionaceae bacterium]MDW8189869.1 potassium transporter TrkG [Pseudobdellovibrionaceae bacterium]
MLLWFILLVIRTLYEYVPHHYLFEMIFDGAALYLIWPMFQKVEIDRAIQAWRFLKVRKNTRKQVELISAIVLDILRLMALFYLGSWYWRWTVVDWSSGISTFQPRYLGFLDTFFLCFFLAQVATAHRWSWWISKLPLNPGRQILLHYLAAILVGALLLLAPFSIQSGRALSVIDALFLSVSALAVTGLTPVDISRVLTEWGQMVLLILIQLGGLGIIIVTAALSLAAYRRLSLSSLLLGQTSFGAPHPGQIPKFLSQVVTLTLFLEALGALFLYFSLPKETPNRVFVALFHSISAFCNAGFSTFSQNLYQSTFGFGGLLVICILILLGGIGFPVIFNIASVLKKNRGVRELFKQLSPQSRLALTVSFILVTGGTVLFFLFEEANLTSKLPWYQVLGQSLFYSISSRTAGFNLVPLDNFHLSAQFFLMLLMFVGASPTSTGGGVKTTTLGVLIATVYSTVFNKDQVVIFNRSVSFYVVKKALAIVSIYLLLAGVAMTLLSITEKAHSFELFFEIISALSTVGLSLGVTEQLTAFGKIVVMFLMMFGRIGILTIVLAGIGRVQRSAIRYPEDDFFVG